jgi:4-alpha-glucanotransferase
MTQTDDRLRELAAAQGIYLEFFDLHGQCHAASPDTLRALLGALGVDAQSPAQVEAALDALRRDVAPVPAEVIVFAHESSSQRITGPCNWSLLDTTGSLISEGRADSSVDLPALEVGYYDLHLRGSGWSASTFVLSRPRHAPDLRSHSHMSKCWGTTGALYGLRGLQNGGLGSYSDLGAAAAVFGRAGAQFFGVNPLHALGWAKEDIISPYSPSHRGMFNTDHIAPSKGLGMPPEPPLINYTAFRARQRPALQAEFDAFVQGRETYKFDAWRNTIGSDVTQFAVFEAISETHGYDFRRWPEPLKAPGKAADKAAGVRAMFHLWLQWRAQSQIEAAQAQACQSGMSLGLYLDLAVGPRPDGAEVWMNQTTIAKGVTIGAPPDHLSPEGQSWALSAHAPGPLAAARYAPLRAMLRTLMEHCGLLRIDHALGLLRSYWLPDDGSPGGYITQPMESLLAVITIEAHQAGCLVVGEDLGLVPNGFREAMNASGLYSYSVWQFEGTGNGDILPAETLPPYSLACFGTHDTPTLQGFWYGADIEWWHRVGWLQGSDRAQRHAHRSRQRASLRRLTGLAPDAQVDTIADTLQTELAKSPAALVSVQLDDVFGELDAQNLPGTINEHPNWRRRLSVPVEQMPGTDALGRIAGVMNAHRGPAPAKNDIDHPEEVSA